jgi:hypothetical protein
MRFVEAVHVLLFLLPACRMEGAFHGLPRPAEWICPNTAKMRGARCRPLGVLTALPHALPVYQLCKAGGHFMHIRKIHRVRTALHTTQSVELHHDGPGTYPFGTLGQYMLCSFYPTSGAGMLRMHGADPWLKTPCCPLSTMRCSLQGRRCMPYAC